MSLSPVQIKEASVAEMIHRFRTAQPTSRIVRDAMRENGDAPCKMWYETTTTTCRYVAEDILILNNIGNDDINRNATSTTAITTDITTDIATATNNSYNDDNGNNSTHHNITNQCEEMLGNQFVYLRKDTNHGHGHGHGDNKNSTRASSDETTSSQNKIRYLDDNNEENEQVHVPVQVRRDHDSTNHWRQRFKFGLKHIKDDD